MDCQLASNKADYGGAIHNDSRGKVRIQTTTAEDGLIPGLTTFSNNLSNADGGAIFNNSSMSIGNSIFADNSSKKGGGGLTNWTSGIAKIWNTTFVTNSARNGGAIDSAGDGQVHLQNTTFSGNSASEFGGALVNYDSAMIDIKFSTFYENSASNGSAIGQMGGPITAGNSVFARPTQSSTSSLCNATVTSLGWNIADDTSCFLPQNTDLQPVDPLLDPLADNGGFTQTHALLPGSPAIDLIPFKDCALKFDQREVSRQQGSGCDSGAYELIQFSEFLFMPLVRGK
jgi:predicted outer membrane repeat protein